MVSESIRRRVNRLNFRSNIDIYDPSFHDAFSLIEENKWRKCNQSLIRKYKREIIFDEVGVQRLFNVYNIETLNTDTEKKRRIKKIITTNRSSTIKV
jgi:hypothetical protein